MDLLDDIGAVLVDLWSRASVVEPAPDGTTALLVVGAAVALVLVPGLWSVTRHVDTLLHEAAHATCAVLTGRRLTGIRLHRDTSGLTVSVGRPRGAGMVLTLFAGYPGPAVVGLAGAWAVSAGRGVGLAWALLGGLVLVLPFLRNGFALVTVGLCGIALGVLAWRAPAAWVVATMATVCLAVALGAVRTVVELAVSRRRERQRGRGRRGAGSSDDAAQLARITPAPAWLWLLLMGLVAATATAAAGILVLDLAVR